MPEQPTTPPVRRWSAHPDASGIVGASAHLADDEHPVTVPARPYRVTQSPWIADPARTAAQAAAFQALEDAAYRKLAEHAKAVHRSIEAAMLGMESARKPTAAPAPRRSWFARAIGWFRR